MTIDKATLEALVAENLGLIDHTLFVARMRGDSQITSWARSLRKAWPYATQMWDADEEDILKRLVQGDREAIRRYLGVSDSVDTN